MRLAVVGWATDSGVGRELTDAVKNLPVSGAFLLTHTQKRNRFDLVPESIRQISGGLNPIVEMQSFLDKHKPDVVLTWESPGRYEFPAVWMAKGVRWVCVVHWDWFPGDQADIYKLADLVAPNEVCREGLAKLGLSSTLLPVPLDLRGFPFMERKKAERFGMAYGAGGPHGRRSLKEVLEALEDLPDPPLFTVRSQGKCEEYRAIRNSQLVVGNVFDPAEVYRDMDVALQPSKFEGVGLSLLEAQGCGVPVVTVDAEPMKTLAPDLLVTGKPRSISTMQGNELTAWDPSIEDLKRVISEIRGRDIGALSKKALENAERFSWDRLRQDWKHFLFSW